ncbi:MAG: response regulator transcription factor [Anaerolineaceae bacterium]|nr:response regulator transcription factor [Anaerolineaceae bacterium]
MAQVILLQDPKKMTVYHVAESANDVASSVQAGDWELPEPSAPSVDLSKMCMLRMSNLVVLLPKDYQWEILSPDEYESPSEISPRQQQVLQALANGLTTKQIAYKLGISQRTVMAHIQATKERFGTYTRAQTVSHAMSRGLINME